MTNKKSQSDLSDKEIRDTLRKMSILYPSLFDIAKTFDVIDQKAWIAMFRRLAECWQALEDVRIKAIRIQAHLDLQKTNSIKYAIKNALDIENIARRVRERK